MLNVPKGVTGFNSWFSFCLANQISSLVVCKDVVVVVVVSAVLPYWIPG